jgi:hypothetical protein
MKGLKTGGRKSGTPNKATQQRRQLIAAMTANNATPLEFLLALMRCDSPLIDLKMKVEAARIAAPYCHVKAGEEKQPDPKLVEAERYTPQTDPLLSGMRRPRLAGISRDD